MAWQFWMCETLIVHWTGRTNVLHWLTCDVVIKSPVYCKVYVYGCTYLYIHTMYVCKYIQYHLQYNKTRNYVMYVGHAYIQILMWTILENKHHVIFTFSLSYPLPRVSPSLTLIMCDTCIHPVSHSYHSITHTVSHLSYVHSYHKSSRHTWFWY